MNNGFRILIIVSLIFSFLSACTTSDNLDRETTESIQKLVGTKYRNHKFFLFVPIDGCGPCITEIVHQINSTEYPKSLAVILSSFDKASIVGQLAYPTYTYPNLVLDTSLLSRDLELVHEKPVLYFLDQNLSLRSITLDNSYENKKLHQIMEYLSKK